VRTALREGRSYRNAALKVPDDLDVALMLKEGGSQILGNPQRAAVFPNSPPASVPKLIDDLNAACREAAVLLDPKTVVYC
jgi:hypothetical protein